MKREKLLKLSFLIEGVALILALLLAWLFDISLLPFTESPVHDILLGTLCALLPLSFFIFTLSKKVETIPLLKSLRKTMIQDVKFIFSDARVLDIISISLIAGVAEELLFRGVIQVRFGIVTASIVFGLFHAVTPVYIFIATLMGFYIGALFNIYHGLLLPIWLHFTYDLGALLYLKYFVKTEGEYA